MPRLRSGEAYPRALGREVLDEMLLRHAADCGAEVLQPLAAMNLIRRPEGFVCHAAARRGAPGVEVETRSVIAAHGSWEPGALDTQPPHLIPAPSDLLGFKADLGSGAVPPNTIVLAPFPGGYAGLVERGAGQATFACCVRRDALERMRAETPGMPAGETVFRHAPKTQSLQRKGPWLAAGPLRPGTRPLYRDGVFTVGNAAGEAHPVVGEGIAMAMQSAALLCRPLGAALQYGYSQAAVTREYARGWRRNFAFRLWASARFAQLVLHPSSVETLLACAPSLLGAAARINRRR